jgi:hypothetical protein
MNTEPLIQMANEYAERASRVGNPAERDVLKASYKVAYLKGLQDGIEYAKAEFREAMAEVSRG